MAFVVIKNSSYLYEFDETRMKLKPEYKILGRDEIKFSKCMHFGFDKVIGNIHMHHYILGLVYFTKDGQIDDTQLSITGSELHEESSDVAAIREMCEEVGLCTDSEYLSNCCNITISNRQYFTCTVDANQCDSDVHRHSFEQETKYNNNRMKKVQVIVHGDIECMQQKLSEISERLISNDISTILGLRLISQQDAYEVMKKIMRSKRK